VYKEDDVNMTKGAHIKEIPNGTFCEKLDCVSTEFLDESCRIKIDGFGDEVYRVKGTNLQPALLLKDIKAFDAEANPGHRVRLDGDPGWRPWMDRYSTSDINKVIGPGVVDISGSVGKPYVRINVYRYKDNVCEIKIFDRKGSEKRVLVACKDISS